MICGKKRITGIAEGKEPYSQRKEREKSIQGNAQGQHFPKAISWKNEKGWREADFFEFLQPVGLRDWSSKVSRLGWDRDPSPREKASKQTRADSTIQRSPKVHGGETVHSSWSTSVRGGIHRDISWRTKELQSAISSRHPTPGLGTKGRKPAHWLFSLCSKSHAPAL